MWFVLGPLIFYLESLVFRYIPLARGDVWEKKGGLASSLPAQNMWRSFLVSWRFLEESGGQLMLYLPLPLQPFITASHDLSFARAPM